MNMGGALDRPLLNEIWEDVQTKLKGAEVTRVSYTKQSFFKTIAAKLMG